MKVSSFARPDRSIWIIAAAYLAAHLPFLAPNLEDVDAINFALGLREFNPALHQPHPPGYPVYIALGRVSLWLISALWSGLGQTVAEARALAIWSALGGAAAIVALFYVFRELERESGSVGAATTATLLAAVAPVFWISGSRPMSDMPGLALAIGAQAFILQGRRDRGRLIAGACLSGLAA